MAVVVNGAYMPPTPVNVAFGVLMGAALLGAAFDRRSVLVVALAAALPDLDAVASLVVHGATNAALHNAFVPAAAAALVYWDAERREESFLRARYGWRGVRVAWVAVAAFAVAGIGADLFNHEAVNLLYPVHDRFYAVFGRLLYSTQDGVVQTYVQFGGERLLQSPGTTANYHVPTWVNPTPGTDNPAGVERRLRLVESGWQAVVVAASAAVLAIRLREVR